MPAKRTNRSELDDLTTAQRTAVSEGAVLLDNLTGRASFNAWMGVARGIVPLCTLADKPGRSRNARRSLFKEAGYGRLSEANVSRLLHMGRLETQIAIWRTGLTTRQRDTWNSPATICKRCPDVRKAIEEANKNKPPRQARPRPAADPVDELERTINRMYDLLNKVEDIDLRRQHIERAKTLLSELSEPERRKPEPPTTAISRPVKAKPTKPAKAKGALKWTETQNPKQPEWPSAWAPAAEGRYRVLPAYNAMGPGKREYHYRITQELPKGGERSIADAKILSEAKAVAEADHAAGKDIGAKANVSTMRIRF
jgi:hypothetical protein